jgi:protein-disulfide isomerase
VFGTLAISSTSTALESLGFIYYNCSMVIGANRSQQGLFLASLLALTSLASVTAGCKQKAATSDPSKVDVAKDVLAAANRVDEPVDKTPLAGVDVSKLPDAVQEKFYRFIGSLSSPCGKAQSLRTSVTSDQSCKRAVFAAQYVLALVQDAAEDDVVIKQYEGKYKPEPDKKINVEGAPMIGASDAPVKMVEFFDYGCPACVQFHPELDKVLEQRAGKVAVYFKMFPLVKIHPDSQSAAQAALAAHAQGKFAEMHNQLFKTQTHKKDDVMKLASGMGLDMAKFAADYEAANTLIAKDVADGEAAGVNGTPSVFFNNRDFTGPRVAPYVERWIDEEIAVNR